ncbi:hypothetical protein C7B67_02115 [filamentous cyanobacterium Phorm 6]|nr:hypothetical protein C7B67_02115 [filamentous cyanobacterium Phorm 6]
MRALIKLAMLYILRHFGSDSTDKRAELTQQSANVAPAIELSVIFGPWHFFLPNWVFVCAGEFRVDTKIYL